MESEENHLWLETSKRLVSEFESKGGSKSVIFGTCAEDSWDSQNVLDENFEVNPLSKYAKSKAELLEIINKFIEDDKNSENPLNFDLKVYKNRLKILCLVELK